MFTDKPTLTGERVILRPVTVDDVPGLAAMLDDPEGRQLTGTHATFTSEQLYAWYATRGGEPDRLDLAVVDRATGGYAGEVVLNDLDEDNLCCGFRISLGPAARGRGLGTEATRLTLGYAFGIGLHRVELEVYAFNPRAQAVYEKVGFVREGVRRDALRWDGGWVDAVTMAALATEWR
ncbi:GNAT family protein [Virgisporangium ochraceum]|uniref:Acetyltransferase n=1 Tax=Virgisporangium ochraceum TaxID=65505 RepID=A0A8J4ECX7_9ACTN|nr:acetyltransferase [Virgisporangium ochraceum]